MLDSHQDHLQQVKLQGSDVEHTGQLAWDAIVAIVHKKQSSF